MRPYRRITPRALVLVVVLAALALSAALPLREYLAQRSAIGEQRQQQAAAQIRVDDLDAERARLHDPAYVAAQARRRLQYVLPGETAYELIDPTPPPAASPTDPAGGSPWYSQLWGSVRRADRPAPAPTR